MTPWTPCRRLLAATCIALSAGCGSDPEQTSPDDRAVTLHTTACGDASGTTGSGVIVETGLVLTAAHVVVGAADVVATPGELTGFIVLLDHTRDLALVAVPGVDAEPPEIVELDEDQRVHVVGGAASGTVEATVERPLLMDVDDVRSTTRSMRAGYELDAATVGGDSGAGVFDDDGRLAGIVFAVPTARDDATFAVGARELRAVLTSADRADHRCDPDISQVVRDN